MDPTSAEKRTALLLRHSRLHRLTILLRCLEALALSAAVLWSSARIPSAAAASGDLLRRLLPVVLGPRFLFLLGNAIVLTLLFKSRRLPPSSGDAGDVTTEISISAFAPPPQLPPPPEEVVFEDKRVMYCVEERAQAQAPAQAGRVCRRSRSEKVRETRRESPELRRSETEVGKKKGEEDAEEFRRTIEAFIERQLKFQREESMAMVVCSAGTAEQHKQVTA